MLDSDRTGGSWAPCLEVWIFWENGEPPTEGLCTQGCYGEIYLDSLRDSPHQSINWWFFFSLFLPLGIPSLREHIYFASILGFVIKHEFNLPKHTYHRGKVSILSKEVCNQAFTLLQLFWVFSLPPHHPLWNKHSCKILQLQNKDQGTELHAVVWFYHTEFSCTEFGLPIRTKGQFTIYLLCAFAKLLGISAL